jgi:hypothetical protein
MKTGATSARFLSLELPPVLPNRWLFLSANFNTSSPLIPLAVVNDHPMDLYLQPRPTRGIWHEQAAGDLGGERVSLRWRGMIELATTRSTRLAVKTDPRSTLPGIDLEGDWPNSIPGAPLLTV